MANSRIRGERARLAEAALREGKLRDAEIARLLGVSKQRICQYRQRVAREDASVSAYAPLPVICKRGHVLAEVGRAGPDESCAACYAEQYPYMHGARPHGNRRDTCWRGHDLTAEGARIADGRCTLCNRENARLTYQRQKAAREGGA